MKTKIGLVKKIVPVVFVMALLIGLVMASSLSVSNISKRDIKRADVTAIGAVKKFRAANLEKISARKQLKAKRLPGVNGTIEIDIEKLKEKVPESYELTVEKIEEANVRWGKYLMWTGDGEHIMWGKYRARYFIGTDNLGKKAWGIYGNGFFAGFYNDGEFFYGKYRRGHWRAKNLFGEEFSSGRYVLFPGIVPHLTIKE
jgi:hypothetical protein